MASLAEVSTDYASTFTSMLAAQIRHGYLMRWRETSSAQIHNTRIYVKGWMTSAYSGGVLGVQLKYQVIVPTLLRHGTRKMLIAACISGPHTDRKKRLRLL